MKYLSFFIVVLFMQINAFSQEEMNEVEHTIVIDFNTKQISELPEGIKVGEYYQIHIKNINMNVWNINYSSKDTLTIKPLSTPTFEDITITNLSTLIGSFNSFVSTQSFSIGELNRAEKRVISNAGGDVTNTCDEFANQLAYSPAEALGLFTIVFENVKKKYDDFRFNVQLYELKLLEDLPVEQTAYHYESSLRKVEEIKESLASTEEVVNEIRKVYDSVVNIPVNRKCLNKNKDLQTLHSKNLEIYNKFQAKIVEFRDQLKADKILTLIKNVHFLKNGDNEYKSLPIQFNGEKAEVSLKFSPKKPEYNRQKYDMNFQFPKTNTDNYWSIGASIFASTLSDERFSVVGQKVNDSTTVYNVIREKEDDLEFGISSMLRFGKKFDGKENIGYHGSFGVGVNIGENIRPRLLLGTGISVGKKHSISIDIGLIAGYTDDQSNAIDLETTYDIKPEETTVTKLNFGGFISLGYLFRL